MSTLGSLASRTRWLIWHPEQKLWNWSLVRAVRARLGHGPASRVALTGLIGVDSLLLAGRVWARRLRRRALGTAGPPEGTRPPVLYIDCGVHKRGEQIRSMHRWFADRYELHVLGFEASAVHVRDATAALADLDGVRLLHLALVGPHHAGDEVRLYKSPHGEGEGDSLFVNERDEYEVVPARRLSDAIADEGYSLAQMPVILRMNIEGAEHFVIEDLLDAGLHTSVDGYYGMWDDLSQIDRPAASAFRRLLRRNGIATLTFNDRDLVEPADRKASFGPEGWIVKLREMSFALRRRAIRRDIEASLRAGLRRVGREAPSRPAEHGEMLPSGSLPADHS
ncbi:MAG TPA: hypothetical protein VGN08_03000 [Solirubrobacteraceae bacterium]|jgi:hypothetical protein